MSSHVGNVLPREILDSCSGRSLDQRIGQAYLLVTVDEDGSPRPCMLSVGELLAMSPQHLRVAVWRGTQTANNLRGHGRPLLCWVDSHPVTYVYARAQKLHSDTAMIECFELTVERVSTDEHKGLPIVSGIRFGLEGMTRTELLEMWETQMASLRHAKPA